MGLLSLASSQTSSLPIPSHHPAIDQLPLATIPEPLPTNYGVRYGDMVQLASIIDTMVRSGKA